MLLSHLNYIDAKFFKHFEHRLLCCRSVDFGTDGIAGNCLSEKLLMPLIRDVFIEN